MATRVTQHTAATIVPLGTWIVDPSHSSVEFVARHLMISKVRGRFSGFEGEIRATERGLEFDGGVDVATISTNEPRRDEHLRSADFFDAGNHPTLQLASTDVQTVGDELLIEADLTMRGQTHPVQLRAEVTGMGTDPWGGERVGLEARGELDRRQWGLSWNQALEAGGVVVGDTIKIQINVSAVRGDG